MSSKRPAPASAQVFDNPTGWVADHIRRYVESGGQVAIASTGTTPCC